MSQKFASVSDTRSHPRLGLAPHTCTMRSASGNGSGFSSTPYTTLKSAVVAPMPSASMPTIAPAKSGCLRRNRSVPRTSCFLIGGLRRGPGLRADRAGTTTPLPAAGHGEEQRVAEPAGAQRRAYGPRPAGRRRFHAEHEDLLHVGADLSTDRGRRREQHDAVQASEHGVRSMTCEGAGRVAARTAGSAAWRAPRPRRPPGAPPPPRTFGGRAA